MELTTDEKNALIILLRCKDLEYNSKIVSKTRLGKYNPKELLNKLGDSNKFSLKLIRGYGEEMEILLAKLSVYAKVLSDISDLNLMEAYEKAASKLKKERLIPQLVHALDLNEKTRPDVRPDLHLQKHINLDELFQQLRVELWESVSHQTKKLLRDENPFLFTDPEVAKIAEHLIEKNLEIEFKERRRIIKEFDYSSEALNVEELPKTASYIIRENMKYWVKHWAIEEIDHELKTTKM